MEYKNFIENEMYYYKLNIFDLQFLTKNSPKSNCYYNFLDRKFPSQYKGKANFLIFKSHLSFYDLKNKGGNLIEIFTGNMVSIGNSNQPNEEKLDFNKNDIKLCVLDYDLTKHLEVLNKSTLIICLNAFSEEYKNNKSLQVVQDFEEVCNNARQIINFDELQLNNACNTLEKYKDQILERRKQFQAIN